MDVSRPAVAVPIAPALDFPGRTSRPLPPEPMNAKQAFESDLRSLLPAATVSRREIMVTSLAAGFALAARPVMTQTVITTDTTGLVAGEVKIPVADGQIPAYRAQPASGGPFPVVLVLQEIFGVHEHIKDVCRRFAKLGYQAIAPEMFARQGDPSRISDIQRLLAEIVSHVPDAQVFSDLDATVAWAGANGGDAGRLAVTGFCWGGRITWLYAARNPRVKAGVAWYGKLDGPRTELQPLNPVDVAASLKAPVLGLYGGKDTGIPLEEVQAMRAALKSAGQQGNAAAAASRIDVFPEAPHGFHADYRASYREAEAKEAFARLQQWFRDLKAA